MTAVLLSALAMTAIVAVRYLAASGLFAWLTRRRHPGLYAGLDAQVRREIGWSLASAAIYGVPAGVVAWGWQERGWTLVYTDVTAYPLWWRPASLLLFLAAHDSWFYWTHRLLHRPAWFRAAHAVHHALDDVVARPEIRTELPRIADVAEAVEEAPQRNRAAVAGAQARQHEHRMAVAARRRLQEGPGERERRPLEHGAALHRHQQGGRGLEGFVGRRTARLRCGCFHGRRELRSCRAAAIARATRSGRATTSRAAVSPNSSWPA